MISIPFAGRLEAKAIDIELAAALRYDEKLLQALASSAGACDAILLERLADETRKLAQHTADADELNHLRLELDEAQIQLQVARHSLSSLEEEVDVSAVRACRLLTRTCRLLPVKHMRQVRTPVCRLIIDSL